MRKQLFSHPGLKIAALVIAFVIWLVIMNVNDPVTRKTIHDIPITVTNTSYVEERGYSYRIADGFTSINVSVRSNRSAIESLSASSITATADLTQIIGDFTHQLDEENSQIMVPVTVTVPGISQDNYTASPRNIEIVLEEIQSKDFVISATTNGTSPAKGYEVGDMQVDPETITIRGAGSLIDKIDRVVAAVDVTEMKADAELSPVIQIYDKNGDILSDEEMSYLTIGTTDEEIGVEVTIYSVMDGIGLEAEAYGTPKAGYQLGTITLTPSDLSVVGSGEALAELESDGSVIRIPADSQVIDLTNADRDFEVKIDITDFLPEGIDLADGLSSTVVASVQILPYNSKALTL
ncbi:MAG: CdaR family protein, partial [Lachnospiraceae bacterium]|nr:CdaR family protein [Lachnospiraceae bacterium]